jgi:hypothetical protein
MHKKEGKGNTYQMKDRVDMAPAYGSWSHTLGNNRMERRMSERKGD